jgi:hypothetical protein
MVKFEQKEDGVAKTVAERTQRAQANIAALQLMEAQRQTSFAERSALAAERSAVAGERLAAAVEALLVCIGSVLLPSGTDCVVGPSRWRLFGRGHHLVLVGGWARTPTTERLGGCFSRPSEFLFGFDSHGVIL